MPRVPRGGELLSSLDQAEWRYNADADEMNVLLPGWRGREGRAVLVGEEFYVRLDVESGQPLSILIPAYTHWLASQLAEPDVRERLPLLRAQVDSASAHGGDAEREALARAVERAGRQSPAPAAIG